jgi:hypothetical protein
VASTSKRSAKVICRGGSVWVSAKQFWSWVRDGLVEYVSEPPLTGKFQGAREHFLISVQHVILDLGCPEHMNEVSRATRQLKNRR